MVRLIDRILLIHPREVFADPTPDRAAAVIIVRIPSQIQVVK